MPINQLDSGSGANPFDEAEFELLDSKMMIEQFMAGSSVNLAVGICRYVKKWMPYL